ncbi:uncharacterized protein [Diadema setosum]|uniref:uncharacterized protein n=1 Tax=Diadema setosum TaxID=31175 RepID=UPI003B3A5E4A
MAGAWTKDEERLLLQLRSEAAVNEELSGTSADAGTAYESLLRKLAEHGIEKTKSQMHNKLKYIRSPTLRAENPSRGKFHREQCETTGLKLSPRGSPLKCCGAEVCRKGGGVEYEECDEEDLCERRGTLQDNQQPAEELQSVNVGYYGMVATNGRIITCLNITFEINRRKLWEPSTITLTQEFPRFDILHVTFDIAPAAYNFESYYVILMCNGEICDYIESIPPLERRDNTSGILAADFDLNMMEEKPPPGSNITVIISRLGGSTSKQGPVLQLKENPCKKPDRCGEEGTCIITNEGDYICQCPDWMMNLNNQSCIEDPCKETDICGPRGRCVVTSEGGFECQCPPGSTMSMNNRSCMVPTVSTPKAPSSSLPSSLVVVIVVVCIAPTVVIVFVLLYRYRKKVTCHPPMAIPDAVRNPNSGEEEQDINGPTECLIPPASNTVLFAYPEDNRDFVKLVEKTALFLKTYGGVEPILPSQQTLEIGRKGAEKWVDDVILRARKILWISSKSAKRLWREERESRQQLHSEPPYGNMFTRLITMTKDERETGNRGSKHAVAFFSAESSGRDVPRIFNEMLRYELPADMESMCLYLLGMERDEDSFTRIMPYISGKISTKERRAVENALAHWPQLSPAELYDSGFSVAPESRKEEEVLGDDEFEEVDGGGFDFCPVNPADGDLTQNAWISLSMVENGHEGVKEGELRDKEEVGAHQNHSLNAAGWRGLQHCHIGVRNGVVDKHSTDSGSFDTAYGSLQSCSHPV